MDAHVDEDVAVAALNGDVETLSDYLDAGGDPNASLLWNQAPTTLLILAALNGEIPAMRLLVSRGAKLELADAEGYTALLMATAHVYRTGVESVRFLLDAGADVNHAFPKGTTALMHASCPVARHYVDVYYQTAKLLVERGAKVDRRNAMGVTALSEAEDCDAERTRKLLTSVLQKRPISSYRRECSHRPTCANPRHGS